MKTKNEQAFPSNDGDVNYHPGITKLEYFAGLAMQGLASASNEEGEWTYALFNMVSQSFDIAEAMLKESEKRK